MNCILTPAENRYIAACILLMRAEVHGNMDEVERLVGEGIQAEMEDIVIPLVKKLHRATREASRGYSLS